MKPKSWHFALLGIVLQAVLGVWILSSAKGTDSWSVLAMALVDFFVLMASALGIIPLALLFFQRTRRVGGVVSILFGIAGIGFRAGLVVGIFLIIAGILSLWRKI